MKANDWFERKRAADVAFARAAAEVDFLESLADYVVSGRLALEMTQASLAKAAGTTQATVSAIETASGNPTAETIGRVLAVLGIPSSILLEEVLNVVVPAPELLNFSHYVATEPFTINLSGVDLAAAEAAFEPRTGTWAIVTSEDRSALAA